ncbi:MAG: MbtH family protein [Pseudonocardiaceae bacterium]
MSMNPFAGEDGTSYALINAGGRYSLWPTFADGPAGWAFVRGAATRKSCRDHAEEQWNDMRPRSLIEQMEPAEKSRSGA